MTDKKEKRFSFTRREILGMGLAGSALGLGTVGLYNFFRDFRYKTEVFAARAADYSQDFAGLILSGFRELGIRPGQIRGRRILLKPNLVETFQGAIHINTHPAVVQGAIDAFFSLGAESVIIAEGPGHCRDSFLLVEESGMGEILKDNPVRFVDINYDDVFTTRNGGRFSGLDFLTLPKVLREVDWIVSMAKMKTHHWAGVTLSMKNLFGIMPGSYYGWPKNVLHWAGIGPCIFDINASVKPHFAIVDGVVGMQGDGPIMGEPKKAGLLVMGQSLPAVDATCARLMGINPYKIEHLNLAARRIGTIEEQFIEQRGEALEGLGGEFSLLDHIPAQRSIRLKT